MGGRRIINVSWTSTGLTPLESETITGNGVVLTLAAGNVNIISDFEVQSGSEFEIK